MVVSGTSRRHSDLCFNTLSQSLYLSLFRLPRRNAIASDARCRHSGVACFILAGGHYIRTIVLAPPDRSRSAGSNDMSNPLRMAKAKLADVSVAMAGSRSGLSPPSFPQSQKWAVQLGFVVPPSGLARLPTHRFCRSETPRYSGRARARLIVFPA